jgi:hypothetical protein
MPDAIDLFSATTLKRRKNIITQGNYYIAGLRKQVKTKSPHPGKIKGELR